MPSARISGTLASAEWASLWQGASKRNDDASSRSREWLIDETERAAGASFCVQSGARGPGIRFSAGVTSPAERVETDITATSQQQVFQMTVSEAHLVSTACSRKESRSTRRMTVRPPMRTRRNSLVLSSLQIVAREAVELDFMEPLVAGRRLGLQHGQLRLDEPRHFRRGGYRNDSSSTLDHHSTQNASLPRNP